MCKHLIRHWIESDKITFTHLQNNNSNSSNNDSYENNNKLDSNEMDIDDTNIIVEEVEKINQVSDKLNLSINSSIESIISSSKLFIFLDLLRFKYKVILSILRYRNDLLQFSQCSIIPSSLDFNFVQKDIPIEFIEKNEYSKYILYSNLKDSFLDVAFGVIKKGGLIQYYGFYPTEEKDKLKELIIEEAKKTGRKVKILKIKEAGEIGVKKFRYRVDFRVLN